MVRLEFRNYRRFADQHPATLQIEPGFTALVGPNNAGKSSLLRAAFELRQVLHAVQSNIGRREHDGSTTSEILGVRDASSIGCDANERPVEVRISAMTGSSSPADAELRVELERGGPSPSTSFRWRLFRSGCEVPTTTVLRTTDSGEDCYVDADGTTAPAPGLLAALRAMTGSYYVPAARNVLSQNAPQRLFDMEVGSGFIEQWHQCKNGTSKTKRERALRVEEGIRAAFGLDRFTIDVSSDSVELHLSLNRASYRMTDVGSGMAHWVMLLAKVAIEPPRILFLDEPETGMHPRLQLDLLQSVATHVPAVVFATHSLGLARGLAARIYSVVPSGRGSIVRPFHPSRSLAELAGEMGFASLQEIGFDRILLVEGPTDVLVFREWLRLFGKEAQVLVMPLCGDSLIHKDGPAHIAELRRITKHISIIIDSERTQETAPLAAGRDAFVKGCTSLVSRNRNSYA